MKKISAMMHGVRTMVGDWFAPNRPISTMSFRIMVIFQLGLLYFFWQSWNFPLMPKPDVVVAAWWEMLVNGTLIYDLASSLTLCLEATAITVVVSLILVYAAVMKFFTTWTWLFSKLRFNGLVGIQFFFTILTSGTHELKLLMLSFSMVVWFITMMAEEVRQIPVGEYEDARTLGMKEWRVVWEVVIVGRRHRVVEVLAQIAAISWLMLTTVEGMVKTEGGIGAMLVIENKTMRMEQVIALQATITFIGANIDWMWRALSRKLFPYAFYEESNGRQS